MNTITTQPHTTPMDKLFATLCGVAIGLTPILFFALTLVFFGRPTFNVATILGYCGMLVMGMAILMSVGLFRPSSFRRTVRVTSRY